MARAIPFANPPIGGKPIGTVGNDKFPQWGVMLTPATKNGKIIRANNESEKIADLGDGYTNWFQSRSAAQAFIPTQYGPDPLGGLNAIGDLAARLTEANTWIRVGEFAVGAILLYVALKSMFPGTVGAVTSAGKSVTSRIPLPL